MKIEFDIADEKVQHINPKGRSELTRHCKVRIEDILDEATRIEASRNDGASPEITAAIIIEAANYSKRFPIRKKKKWYVQVIQIVAFIASVVTGGLFDIDKFNETSRVIWLLVIFCIAIGSTVYLTFISEQNG